MESVCSSDDRVSSSSFSLDLEELEQEDDDDLNDLGFSLVEQSCLEKNIEDEVNKAVIEHTRKQKRNILNKELKDAKTSIEAAEKVKHNLELRLINMRSRFVDPHQYISVENKLKETKEKVMKLREGETLLQQKLLSSEQRIEELDSYDFEEGEVIDDEEDALAGRGEQLIKEGKMTPFGTTLKDASLMGAKIVPLVQNNSFDLQKYLDDQSQKQQKFKSLKPKTSELDDSKESDQSKESSRETLGRKSKEKSSKADQLTKDEGASGGEDSEYIPSGNEESEEECIHAKVKLYDDLAAANARAKAYQQNFQSIKKCRDDGSLENYKKRLKKWRKEKLRKQLKSMESGGSDDDSDDELFEEFEGGLRIPLSTWNKLYQYQKIGVKWLWELHSQGCGGILGDEMGLGKTVQVISFLIGLSHSPQGLGPVLLVVPATVMHQWVREFHTWWPPFRVAVLHGSGSHKGRKESLIHNISKQKGILISSYMGISAVLEALCQYEWDYVILDEGHKIRNPDAKITTSVKRLVALHRLILSGSPIQNSLKELWSLFDFVFPGKLGTLSVFLQHFAVPITQGGYANASKLEVQTAYKCACVLRDTINPYLLRRMKNDVREHLFLPDKSEQVLFCDLTQCQRDLYRSYLESSDVKLILNRRMQIFVGLIKLRKICNHPDLLTGGPHTFGSHQESSLQHELSYGWHGRSGKMQVLKAVLKIWMRQGHRALIFSQTRQMLNILERFVKRSGYAYLRMDGKTTISARQPMIAKFNGDSSVFIFLLTTRVGGLGVNLTGADRVIIYDPDWNPSTDTQARERTWRIGQMRNVTIYRFLTAGTIEEKIYHRQIFKQFITNRILKDPKQQRFFKTNYLFDLFTLNEGVKEKTESKCLFAGTGSTIKVMKRKRKSTKDSHGMDPSGENLSGHKMSKRIRGHDGSQSSTDKVPESESIPCTPSSNFSSFYSLSYSHKEDRGAQSSTIRSSASDSTAYKKKTRKGKKFEGERLEYLVRKRRYKPPNEDDEKDKLKQISDQDAYVLKKLFKKSSVHTALSHDAIVNTGDADYLILEGEAERVASEALKHIKASREQALLPEQTKHKHPQFGMKKKSFLTRGNKKSCSPKKPQKATASSFFSHKEEATSQQLSSSDILARINQRNVVEASLGADSDSEEETRVQVPSVEVDTQAQEYLYLLEDIRSFMAFQTESLGKASTKEILDKFAGKLPSQDSHVFRALLHRICEFHRETSGKGLWTLKTEFR